MTNDAIPCDVFQFLFLLPFQFPVSVSPSSIDPPDIPTNNGAKVRSEWTKIQEAYENVHPNLGLVQSRLLARI